MSTVTRRYEVEGAQRRLIEQLKITVAPPSTARRGAVLTMAILLFAATFAARLAISDPDALLANFYVVPVAVLAIEFGARTGVLAAVAAVGLVFAWSLIETVHLGALGYSSRALALLVCGAAVGRFAERLRADVVERQRAQRRLALYVDELGRANVHLERTVQRLEAFAEIARAVGGETDLERILPLILGHGREIVAARRLIAYLPDGERLVAVGRDGRPDVRGPEMPIDGSLVGEVLSGGRPARIDSGDGARRLSEVAPDATAAILVPLVFRGERLGVLAALDTADGRSFAEGDEQLLMSIAASAATAIATARSVAAARLHLSLEAAEQARARWARELHDETLQGLSGARMVLSAGLARADLVTLRRAAETAEEHLGEEVGKLRDLIAELRPAALDDLGLGPAIESLTDRQAATGGFQAEVTLELDPRRRLNRDTETATYRIVQEALSNVVKHARASHVTLSLRHLPDRLEVRIEDDGSGFQTSRAADGFGLAGMRERALLTGGSIAVTSAPGAGTSVIAVLPVAA